MGVMQILKDSSPALRAYHESTLTLGKWKKRGAINNSTRIIIKTTGMLQSCQTREQRKKGIMNMLSSSKYCYPPSELLGKQVKELSKLQFDVSTIFTVTFPVRLLNLCSPTLGNHIHVSLVTHISFLPHSHARYGDLVPDRQNLKF